jgi:hypothetical protein
VFQVNTLSGAEVWRRRHYRVRRGKAPGLFNLSVSDNGVTSLEAWRIIACAEDFRYLNFATACSYSLYIAIPLVVAAADSTTQFSFHVLELASTDVR